MQRLGHAGLAALLVFWSVALTRPAGAEESNKGDGSEEAAQPSAEDKETSQADSESEEASESGVRRIDDGGAEEAREESGVRRIDQKEEAGKDFGGEDGPPMTERQKAMAEARRGPGDITLLGGLSTYVGAMWGPNVGLNAHLGRNFAATLRMGSYPISDFGLVGMLWIGPKVGARLQFPVERILLGGGVEGGTYFMPDESNNGYILGLQASLEYLLPSGVTLGVETNLGTLIGVPFNFGTMVNGQATVFVGADL